ncbi:ubiquitin carboxyl-terminal hydrolase Usp2 isoform X1 [Bactrocera oleae]|uniref:ubiquitin carboxyl-terminal hydrolase Usp2 isoform X1 n=1 Tax=Bactrocera oleae TaxID=104688 RepID=UPI00387E4B81
MIDIKKSRNSFEKFPILQEKCNKTVKLAQRQQQQPTNSNLNNYTGVHKPKITTTAAAAVLTTTTKTRPQTTTNPISVNGKAEAKLLNGVGRRAASVGSTRTTKISSNVKSNNNNSTPHNSDDTNPVRAANKPFFLVPQFQDQNFLKEECELAHAQVAPKQQQQQQHEQQKVATANGEASNNSANNNNNTKPKQQPIGNHRCNSGDYSKSNNNTSNSNNHSQKINNPYSIINSIHASISRRTATATATATATTTPATVAAVTANGVRRSGGGSANASVNINQHHHHHHVSTTASAVATTSSNGSTGASAAASVSAKSATTDTTVHKVDIVFSNRAQTQSNCVGRFVTSKSAKQPQQHNTYKATRPLTSATIHTTTTTGASATSTTATLGGGTAAATASKLSNGQSKLVRPLVHRTIPSTAVAAANATAARDNVNAYSNKLFNSYGSNSNRLSNNNNNNINNNGVNTVCNINNSSSSSNNNITSNNTNGGSGVNGMQHTLDHDDIKYIDSDDAPTTAAIAAAHASATTVTTPSRGGAQLERKTQLRCEQLCCPHTNCATSTTATLTGATGGGAGSASLKTRMRPKSTIICSTSNLVFEKINNYKYANGSAGGGSSAAKFVAEAAAARRNELRHSIDSNSIRASIEKFDSFSEQKRSVGAPQVTLRSHGGSGSTNNLQHHRHSGSEFDHATGSSSLLRLAQSGGGSLTRAPYRTVSPAPATACKVTATMHAPSLTTGSTGSSASSIRSGACSTNSLPTKSLGSFLAATTNATSVTAINRHQEATVLRTAERASPSALLHKDAASTPSSSSSSPLLKQTVMKLPNGDVKKCANAEMNGVCDGAAADVETIRSTALRSIPPAPPSPTASRYRDRDSRLTSSSLLSSSVSSVSNNIDDASKSKDENAEGLCGLRNIGNTCFMNSVIQCLSHTSELTKFLRTHNGIRSTSSKDQQILQEFAKLIREMWTSNVHSVTPMDLKRAFSSKHRMYSDYNQQDAQEFLRFFLDSLHSALNTGVKGEHLKIDDNLSDNKKADLTWEWYARHENSLIRDLFVGQLKSTLRCTTCGNTSVTFDPFWDLSVSLPSLSRCKLESCLDLFIREEVLDGDEMPTCAKCRQRRRCTKSFTIQRFPKYLVIHLKRFSETRWSKLSNIVEFPTGERELNMGPYGSNPGTSIYYSLYAISNHMGSTAGGHYVALCKHPVSKKWHEFNDNVVSDTLSENNLVSSSAYILFYERA